MRCVAFHVRFILGLLMAASTVAVAEPSGVPTFYTPGLVDAGKPFELILANHGADVKSWAVQWGDGPEQMVDATPAVLSHIYAKPGSYTISAKATISGVGAQPTSLDYTRLILEDHPTAFFRFTALEPGEPSAPMSDINLKNPPGSVDAIGLPWKDRAALFENNLTRLPAMLTASDRFTIEFWWQPKSLESRQYFFGAENSDGAQLYFEEGKLNFRLSKNVLFSRRLLKKIKLAAWHHIAVTYERVPLFPYQNRTRFYLDGLLIGDKHLDLYDTGAVNCAKAVFGGLSGELADVAFYAQDLPPHRILQHARFFTAPEKRTVFATPPNAEPFTVVLPNITQTVSVPLDPAPDADNGPILQKAIQDAARGTRLVLIEQKTGRTGGAYHFRTNDGRNTGMILHFAGRRDLEIDGGGATLVFDQTPRQFFMHDCERVSLHNFAIDLDQAKFRVGVYARILDLNPTTGDIRFQFVNGRDLTPDRNVPLDITMLRWQAHDPKTLRIGNGPNFKTAAALQGKPIRDPNDASILIGRLKPGMIKTLDDYRQGSNLFVINNAVPANKCFEIAHSSQLSFDHISFYASLGNVFVADAVHHVQITECMIGLPPGLTAADRPLSAGSGGFRFHQTWGSLLVQRNEMALIGDDTITMKDDIWPGLNALDLYSISMTHVRKGDEIELFREDFSPLNYRAPIIATAKGTAQFDQALPADLPKTFLGLNHALHTQNWILADNDLHDNYGHVLLFTPNGMIRGNRIANSWLHLGASATSYENAGISSSVTVYDNFLVNTSADTGLWGPDSKYPVFQDMAFVSNSLIGEGLKVTNAGNPWIIGNYFEPGDVRNGKLSGALLNLWRTQSPVVTGNSRLATQPGEFGIDAAESDNILQQDNTVLVSPASSTGSH